MSKLPVVLAMDVGNSRLKCGLFASMRSPLGERDWPVCQGFTAVPHEELFPWELIDNWMRQFQPIVLLAGSHPAERDRIARLWREHYGTPPLVIVDRQQLPLEISVESPERVGLDRLLNAVAANRLRNGRSPAIVIDSGTATTVDLIDEQGVFAGGAILPGLDLGAKSLHDYTAQLPLLKIAQLGAPLPQALGRNTADAIRSGLFWGQLGAIRELIHQLTEQSGFEAIDLYLTGGAASMLSSQLPSIRWEPHLTLQGLVLAAWQPTSGKPVAPFAGTAH